MNPESDPIKNDARRRHQSRRLPEGAACALCGEINPEVLRSPARSILEMHHAAGEANDPNLIVVLCQNCHRRATNAQRDQAALPPGIAPSSLERLQLALRSLGAFFSSLAESCLTWAETLGQAILSLNAAVPGWRTLPGMP